MCACARQACANNSKIHFGYLATIIPDSGSISPRYLFEGETTEL
jgi:hypothetical protein